MRIVIGESRVRRSEADHTSLLVRVGVVNAEAARERREAAVAVSVADAPLSRAITRAVAEGLGASMAATAVTSHAGAPVVRLRTHKRLAQLGPERLSGAIAVVRVTQNNARRLLELVEGIRSAGARGVQLVWDGYTPERALVERHVFAVLERARASRSGPPVVLATTDEPAEALHILLANRNGRDPRS